MTYVVSGLLRTLGALFDELTTRRDLAILSYGGGGGCGSGSSSSSSRLVVVVVYFNNVTNAHIAIQARQQNE